MSFMRNGWYVAGFGDELAAGQMLQRRLLDEPIVFFRNREGRVTALHDRCPHRFAPLSAGMLVDGGQAVACGYHGLRFGADGRCTHNPHGDGRLPASARVRVYAVEERNGLLWWWAGDPETADVSLIPDYSSATGGPADATVRGYLPATCDYRLIVDNILDLTHADYLHADSLGSGALTRARPRIDDLGPRSLRIEWLSSGDLAPPHQDSHLRRHGEPTDQWATVTWHAPSTMLLQIGATLLGETRADGVEALALHATTPETPSTSHYWFWSSRNYAVDPHANVAISQVVIRAFTAQDKPMLEAVHSNMEGMDFWSLKPVLLPSDAGAVQVRRRIDALISGEGA